MLELYQAEWCPYSHRVRERLTELGLDFVARQVAPWREQRTEMRDAIGVDSIPTLVTEEGEAITDADEILAFLATRYDAETAWEQGHQEQEAAHPELRQGASRRPMSD